MRPTPKSYQRGVASGFRKRRPENKQWFSVVRGEDDPDYTGDPDATTVVRIYDEIDEQYGVSAAEFAEAMDRIETPHILVRINSPGGVLTDGVAMYHTLRNHPAAITTRVDGLAASAASVIAMAGDVRQMAGPGAFMMIHDPWGVAIGDASEMRAYAETLDKMAGTMAALYADRSGAGEADMRQAMTAETWYNGREAVAAGLAHRVLGEDDDDAAIAAAVGRFNIAARFQNAPAVLGGSFTEGHDDGEDDQAPASGFQQVRTTEYQAVAVAAGGGGGGRAGGTSAPGSTGKDDQPRHETANRLKRAKARLRLSTMDV